MTRTACTTADEAAAYSAAAEKLQQIAALQDANAYKGEGCSLILIETALLESTALNGQNGMIGTEEGGYYDLSELNGIELEENQIVVVTRDEGVQIVTIPTEEELQAAADARMASGFIKRSATFSSPSAASPSAWSPAARPPRSLRPSA